MSTATGWEQDPPPTPSCARKEWIPQPERFSDNRDAPSSRTVWKRATRIAESLTGIAPVPRSSTTVRGGRRGPSPTITGGQAKAGGRRRHRVHEADAWVEHRFCDWSRGERTKLERLGWWLKALLLRFRLYPHFGSPTFPSSGIWLSDCILSEGNQKYRLRLAQPLLRISYIIIGFFYSIKFHFQMIMIYVF